MAFKMALRELRDRLRMRSRVKTAAENLLCNSEGGYRSYLHFRYGARSPRGCPWPVRKNATLKCAAEVDQALHLVHELGLVPHPDLPKNWDALGAVGSVLAETDTSDWVLDAGGELYSPVLPCLSLYGYRHLYAVNLSFKRHYKRGPINYRPGDLLQTEFSDGAFGAVSCLSVIEHGVNLEDYFKEMARVLRPGGILVTSTDYWPDTIDTRGATAYGAPVKIFNEQQIISMSELSRHYGFEPAGPSDLTAQEKVVTWKRLALAFTFIFLCFRKGKGK